jgi:hypothetical protein
VAKTGEDLGIELGRVYKAGYTLLPEVADEVRVAWINTPVSISFETARGGDLGANPGSALDSMLDQLNHATKETEDVLRDVGAALVWCCLHYDRMDDAARAEFDRQRKKVEG